MTSIVVQEDEPMLKTLTTYFSPRQRSIAGVLGICGVFVLTLSTSAQTFIEPPAAPTGGNSASWITTSSRTERKLGSLSLGTNTVPASLCLNATNESDAARCVSSWAQVINLSGGPFVALRTTGLAAGAQSDPAQYFSTPAANAGDVGAVAIQATGTNQAISLLVEANAGISSAAYGLFAGDGGVATNYAAYFSGKVGIGTTTLVGGGTGPAGQLCLNSTVAYTSGATAGCVTSWAELVGGLSAFVHLQNTSSMTTDVGTAGVNEIGNFGSVVIGHPPAGQPAKTFCGDGMCSTNLNEDVGADANYCAIDCSTPAQPAQFTALYAFQGAAYFEGVGTAQTPSGTVQLLAVRSANPSFIEDTRTEFTPQNGVSYSTGMVVNGVTIVYAGPATPGAVRSFSDNGLTTGSTYYYRLYQANSYPVYNQTPLTTQAYVEVDCPLNLPPNFSCSF